MNLYHRAKKEVMTKPSKKQMPIAIGNKNDSYDTLKSMYHDKSVELLESIELNDGKEMEVFFWTEDIPELIGVSKFTKHQESLSYSFDDTLSTV